MRTDHSPALKTVPLFARPTKGTKAPYILVEWFVQRQPVNFDNAFNSHSTKYVLNESGLLLPR